MGKNELFRLFEDTSLFDIIFYLVNRLMSLDMSYLSFVSFDTITIEATARKWMDVCV